MRDALFKPTRSIIIAPVLLLLSAVCVWAQGPPPLTTEREQTMRNERDKRTRGPDLTVRSPIIYSPIVRERMLRRAAASELRRDAEQMRSFNGAMMRSVSTGAALDYEHISKSAGEIGKLARRLMRNLGFPETKKEKKPQDTQTDANNSELAASLTKLDGLIKSLSANPLLGSRNVIDARQAETALSDLEEIISLSERIRKSAKRLKEASR